MHLTNFLKQNNARIPPSDGCKTILTFCSLPVCMASIWIEYSPEPIVNGYVFQMPTLRYEPDHLSIHCSSVFLAILPD